ncbi:MAG: hypothetical protein LIP01_15665 [Tannerellaceae bacterium]|nr:hypothetical protein [Tannerellaceae bacterium]
MIDERDVQLPLLLTARNEQEFLSFYNSFLAELQKGVIETQVICGEIDITYYFIYISCQQFTQMNLRMAKYVLRLNEPNPTNRK